MPRMCASEVVKDEFVIPALRQALAKALWRFLADIPLPLFVVKT